jgi:hypothetical protein
MKADLTSSSQECIDSDDCSKSIVSDNLMSFRHRQYEVRRASLCGNTTEF